MKGLTTLVISMRNSISNRKDPVQTVAIKLETHNSLEYHYVLKH